MAINLLGYCPDCGADIPRFKARCVDCFEKDVRSKARRSDLLTFAGCLLFAAFLIVYLVVWHTVQSECDDKGGVLVRVAGSWSGYECVKVMR